MKNNEIIDKNTIEILLKEAQQELLDAQKDYDEWDNHEDGHRVDAWIQTIRWLKHVLELLNKERSINEDFV